MDVNGIIILAGLLLLAIACYQVYQQIHRRHRAELILRQQTERERLIHEIAQHIRQSLNLDEVLATTVADVRQFLDCDRVLIYQIYGDGTGCAITETVLPDYPRILGEVFPAEVFPQEYHQAYINGKSRAIANIEQSDIEECLVEFVQQFAVKAKLVVPIIQTEIETPQTPHPAPHLWGLLIAHHCRQTRQWQPHEIELMKQLATQVAIAIRQSELYQQLQQLNTQLEQRVEQRTEELARTNHALRLEIAERQRTEIALRHTNHTLQSLIAASPRAIFTLDLQDRVQLWNPAAEQMFGWSELEVYNQPNPILSEETVDEYRDLRKACLQGITPPSLELRRFRKDGSPIDIVFSAAPLLDSGDRISGMVAVVADVTEQKRQAEQVRLLQSVVINTNDAVLITEAFPLNPPGPRILYVNQAFTRMTGYTLEELIGQTPRILQGAKTDRQKLEQVKASLGEWQPLTMELINYRKDGSEFWVEFSLVPVANKQNEYTHWVSIQRDISERKHTEEALKRSEERFRSLIENALDIITIVDRQGTIYYASPSVEKVLGYPPTKLMGQNFFDLVHPDDSCKIYQQIINSLESQEGLLPMEFRAQHQEGFWRILEAVSHADRSSVRENGIESYPEPRFVVNSRDITARKRLNEMKLALEREKELHTLKTRFFSMASHEFRTPLSTALAAAQLLEQSSQLHQPEDPVKRSRNLRRIQDSIKQIIHLLDDILTINRAEAGKLEFDPQPLNVPQFCRQLLEEIQLSAGHQYGLKFICSQDSAWVNLDEKLLRSILSNLLSNAIKYSPIGSDVQLRLTVEPQEIVFEISDRGIGISPEDRDKLFEPFQRGQNVGNIPGTGLGLVVTKKCVELQGGTLEVDSQLNLGTTLTVILPIKDF
ncbi:PAS domain S-box protein [Roseofilum sp. BLCC_M154]|uniref:histidine kinase n=1 Tax=Roseofilum acuticapitatum BLCC-M154 TaxID=3022444 RepID=A0ABT7AQQ8_9CYAN|nr:PAS domain S-box protein [Roseofilum acuticapitatum]MDJ1169226.1 PAS domain S-box protein [Roseofilum acuticapitatum BLCC-M154]